MIVANHKTHPIYSIPYIVYDFPSSSWSDGIRFIHHDAISKTKALKLMYIYYSIYHSFCNYFFVKNETFIDLFPFKIVYKYKCVDLSSFMKSKPLAENSVNTLYILAESLDFIIIRYLFSYNIII